MHRYQCTDVRNIKKSRKHDTPNGTQYISIIDPKGYEMPENKFQVMILRKHSKIQENTNNLVKPENNL